MGTMTHEAQCQIENADTKETAQLAGYFLLLLTNVDVFQSVTLRSPK